ncbi:MAG: hypothetical protein L0Z49_06395, partial [Actinobacteria bacterium]|nr:hypothetical protein [Actinomycetota bacterium]
MGEAGSIVDWSKLYVRVDANQQNTLTQQVSPIADVSNVGGWTRTPSTGTLFSAIDEVGFDDTDFISGPAQVAGQSYPVRFRMANTIVPPTFRVAHAVEIRLRRSVGGGIDPQLTVKVYGVKATGSANSTRKELLFETGTVTGSTVFVTQVLPIPEATAKTFGAYKNLEIELVQFFGATGSQLQIATLHFLADTDAQMELTSFRYEYPPAAGSSERRGDFVRIYPGTKTKLYQIDENRVWTDVSKVALYGQGTALPH